MSETPTRGRAILCLLLNIIVFPGLGTLLSGDRSRRKTGLVQLGAGAALLVGLVTVGMGTVLASGASAETAKVWMGNIMLVLVLWNVVTGVQIVLESWKLPAGGTLPHQGQTPPAGGGAPSA